MLAHELWHRCTPGQSYKHTIRESYTRDVDAYSPFVVLDEAHHLVLLRELDELLVVLEQLDGRLRDQYVQAVLNGIFCNVIMGVCAVVSSQLGYGTGRRYTHYQE